jgi:hypothetical protein
MHSKLATGMVATVGKTEKTKVAGKTAEVATPMALNLANEVPFLIF